MDCKPYNTESKDVTWETSSIRRWLNEEFIQAAFSIDEQKQIVKITNKNPNSSKYRTEGGKDTQDKIFLLSTNEAENYFASDETRACEPTAYVVAKDAYVDDENGNCQWWLRTPGFAQNRADFIFHDGAVSVNGNEVDDSFLGYNYVAVRPALWVNLES